MQNFNKKYELIGDILKVHFLAKTLTLCLMKLDQNCRSYCLKGITAESYFVYMLSYQINLKLKIYNNFDRS